MKTPTFFLMDMYFGEVFQMLSSLIAGILFVGNWPEKHSPLWKGQFLKMIFLQIWGRDNQKTSLVDKQ